MTRPAVRIWMVVWTLLAALLVVGTASVCLGVVAGYDVSPVQAVRAVLDYLNGVPEVSGGGSGVPQTVIVFYRLPVMFAAMLAGAALGLAGALSQGIFRNPLAAPSVIGVTSTVPAWMLTPLFASLGAAATAFAVYLLATRRGETHVPTLLLAGIAITAMTGALASLVLAVAMRRMETFQRMFLWQMGGLDYIHWDHVQMLIPGLLVGGIGAALLARELNMLALGERSAMSLGVNTQRVKRLALLIVAVLAGSAVSAVGLIGFVGLVVPHIARGIVGPDHRVLLPASALGGAVFLTLMDLLQRLVVVRWLQMPSLRVGALMGLIGGAFFVALLIRQRHRISGDSP